jgi:hypothetical protein
MSMMVPSKLEVRLDDLMIRELLIRFLSIFNLELLIKNKARLGTVFLNQFLEQFLVVADSNRAASLD